MWSRGVGRSNQAGFLEVSPLESSLLAQAWVKSLAYFNSFIQLLTIFLLLAFFGSLWDAFPEVDMCEYCRVWLPGGKLSAAWSFDLCFFLVFRTQPGWEILPCVLCDLFTCKLGTNTLQVRTVLLSAGLCNSLLSDALTAELIIWLIATLNIPYVESFLSWSILLGLFLKL